MHILVNLILVKVLEKYIVDNSKEYSAPRNIVLNVSLIYACFTGDAGLILELLIMVIKAIYDDAFLG